MKFNYLVLEIKNVLGNFIGLFFSYIFPIMLANIIIFSRKGEIPAQAVPEFKTSVFLLLISVIPISLALVGFPALFSQETDKGVTKRMILFGYTIEKQLINKLIANVLVIFSAVGVYFLCVGWVNEINKPSAFSIIFLLFGILFISIDFFLITFTLTLWLRKFSRVYGVTMTLYFLVMILTGMFGVSPDKFGKIIETIANCIPITLLTKLTTEHWGESFYSLGNYPYVLIGFTAFSIVCYFLGTRSFKKQ
ncbi:ABC transporter permease [Actinomyces sp. zg-332]|uniref:ABC transporter permease n=1 Tax=Actinomyces sp. zg-332 TaxID=2708340 RepID=UPI00141DFC08|nr:ABC transporter permease [Actinomyces sp. zg-332]QPK94180.1 ABC transporter permease [Actinomyces sp. zg-332]